MLLGVLNASWRGTKSAVAHIWAIWMHNPCRPGSAKLYTPGHNQKWPTSGSADHIRHHSDGGSPNAS